MFQLTPNDRQMCQLMNFAATSMDLALIKGKIYKKCFFLLEYFFLKSTKIQIKSRKQKVDNPTYQSADRPCDYCPVDIVVDCIDVVVVQIQSWCVAVLHPQVPLADLYINIKLKER